MPFIDLLGWIAAAVGTSSVLPQLFRLWRERTSAGVSMAMWQLLFGSATAWAIHGFLVGQLQLQLPNLLLALCALAVLWLITQDRGIQLLPRLIWPLGLVVALVVIDISFGAWVFGLLVALPGAFGQVSQLREMRRSSDLSGVSVIYLAMASVMQLLWLSWGVLAPEWAIIMCASILGTLCTINLVYYLRRQISARNAESVIAH